MGIVREVAVDLVAKIAHDRLAELEGEAKPEVKADIGEQHGEEEADDPFERPLRIVVGDGAADDRRRDPAHQRKLDGAQDDEDQKEVPLSCVGLGIAKQAANDVEDPAAAGSCPALHRARIE